ncbi:hypothetical protein KUW64_002798 [Escherichia coli]|nr:hypothetical protein [Escherichia coli]EKL6077472.1 hypothetical protein [Escherichia coli]ELQ1056345.1 hypothetical protein [Escherichia coli]
MSKINYQALREAAEKAGGDFEDEFEVDDDATPDEIHDEAKDIFFNYCNYSYHEIKDEEEEQNG